EEAPAPPPPAPSRERQLLVVSARTAAALEAATDRLADRLEALADDELPDAAYTLMTGRRRFEHRRAVVCTSRREAIDALRSRDPERIEEGVGGAAAGPPAFLLSGLGDHYPGMGLGLYRDEPLFREAIDRAAELLREPLGADLREILYPAGVDEPAGGGGGLDLKAMLGRSEVEAGAAGEAAERLSRGLSRVGTLHPALFAVEVALARLWAGRGVEPAAAIGYSLGEYVAACLAGVMSFEDGLRVVAERARLIEERCGEGAMLAVPLTEEATRERLADGPLSVAAINGPGLTVVAGPTEAVAELGERLAAEGTPGRRLPARHAFHTAAMAPAAGPLAEALGRIELRPPEAPFVSNVTGAWITAEEATDPGYWARHLTSPVRFAEGLETLFAAGHRTFVELGPGQALGSLVHQRAGGPGPGSEGDPAEGQAVVVPTLRAGFERRPDLDRLLRSAGRLWLAGVPLHDPADRVPPASGLWRGEARRRLHLPTYPFERRSYWIDPPAAPAPGAEAALAGAGTGAGAAASERPSGLASVHERPRLGTPYAEPEGELERTLAGVWRRMLGIERVGAHDDFFELGGNSLLGPQVLFQVREAVGIELPVPALLQAPTVARLARLVERARAEGAAAAMESGAVDLREE
ncbi:MAG TPA: acyltransferase domain-containing protein, partial [Thermoanaerobaculia bacterium]|nr:acyltransferase domain-containing protein [Thermoanaerobaculia bacterium]